MRTTNRTWVKIVWSLSLAVLVPTVAVFAKKPEKKSKTTHENVEKTDPGAAYKKIFKGKQHKKASGIFTLHKVDGDVYIELPLSMMGKNMVFGASVIDISDTGESTEGMKPSQPRVIAFTMADTLVQMVLPGGRRISKSYDESITRALEQAGRPAVLESFPLAAYVPDSSAVVFKATKLFLNKGQWLMPKDPLSYNSLDGFVTRTYKYLDKTSFIKDVAAYEDNLSVTTEMTYDVSGKVMGLLTVHPERPVTATMQITFLLPDEKPAYARKADPRVGTAVSAYTLYSDTDQGSKTEYIANRVRLEPSDPAAYAAGKAVDPIEPFIFYLDPSFPEVWKNYIIAGVLSWNDALQEAGYLNALRVETQDLPDINDIRYSTIRYLPTPAQDIRSNVWVNPADGEIVSANIYISHNIMKKIQRDRLLLTGNADPRARTLDMPEQLWGESLEAAVAHHTGRCLGLSVNLAGSAAIPADSLLSPSYTRAHGISSSIMDELPLNFMASRKNVEDGAALCQKGPGIYDYFAIRWLYTPVQCVAGIETELEKEASQKSGVASYLYGRRESSKYAYDPRAISGDLGDNSFRAAEAGLKNLSQTITNLSGWIDSEDEDFTFRSSIYRDILSRINSYIKPLLTNIGGIYLSEPAPGRAAIVPVAANLQRKSLKTVLELSDRLDWIGEYSRNEDSGLNRNAQGHMRNAIIKSVISQANRMHLSASKSEDPYTRTDAYRDVKDFLFDSRAGKPIADYQTDINKYFVSAIVKNAGYSLPKAPKASGSTSISLSDSQVADDEVSGTWAITPISGILFDVAPEERHLMYGLVEELLSSLRKCSNSATTFEDRNHYDYLIHYIETAKSL